jgi:hypothetical protein
MISEESKEAQDRYEGADKAFFDCQRVIWGKIQTLFDTLETDPAEWLEENKARFDVLCEVLKDVYEIRMSTLPKDFEDHEFYAKEVSHE